MNARAALALVIVWASYPTAAPAAPRAQAAAVFASWDDFETDKLASIWLIKRHINPHAQIQIYPKDTPLTGVIAFDTRDAKLRRYHNLSTFECLLREYRLNDPKLQQLGRIIHDIEINTWASAALPESLRIRDEIRQMIDARPSTDWLLSASLAYFDDLYQHVSPLPPEIGTASEGDPGRGP